MDANEKLYVDAKYVANVFGVTVRRIQQLTQDGVLSTEAVDGGRRKYDLAQSIQGYVAYWKNKATGNEKTKKDAANESDKLAAEVRLKNAKAETAELELEELRGTLHSAEDVEAVMTDHILLLRSMILALPGRLAVDVCGATTPAEAADIIKTECYAMLNQLADYEYNPDEYQRRVRERKGWDARTDGVESDE